jgi:hypothetical protein
MPKQAERNAHANDDGIIDRKEQKAINKAKSDALRARHRGIMGYKSARTSKWAKGQFLNTDESFDVQLITKKSFRLTYSSVSFHLTSLSTDGLKDRVRSLSMKIKGEKERDQTVATEA